MSYRDDEYRSKAVAIFRNEDGSEDWVMPYDYAQVGWVYGDKRRAGDASPIVLSFMQDDECIKAPVGNLYHVWHICTCDKCTRVVQDGAMGDIRLGGRIWDHSQASFNEHLRFVGSRELLTFNTVK